MERFYDNKTVYLGWVPLKDDDIMLRSGSKPIRNDNDGMSFRHVPLYFIFLKPRLDNKLAVLKIIHNPTIDIKIDVCLLKKHLCYLTHETNTTLDIQTLRTFDNGRWYFELSGLYNLTSHVA